MYLIYKITNLINKKIYIGLTKRKLNRRWSSHCYESRVPKEYKSSLYSAIRKYGEHSFKIEEVEKINSKNVKDALKAETKWILNLESFKKKIGYNMKISQTYRSSEHEEGFKKSCSIKSQGRKRKTKKYTQYLGVSKNSRSNGFFAVIGYSGKYYTKGFPTDFECAKFYDKMALYFFGEGATINFEEDRTTYLSLDLRSEISSIFLKYNEKFNKKFVGVSERTYLHRDGSFASVFCAKVRGFGNLGTFDSELEAAEARDKIILFLNLEKKRNIKLNFPEKKEIFKGENLQEFYEKIKNRPHKRKQKFKNASYLLYTLESPNGEIFHTENLTKFCRENNLKQKALLDSLFKEKKVSRGKSFGWRIVSKTYS